MISVIVISKDEPGLGATLTGIEAEAQAIDEPVEIIVVDASQGRLAAIRTAHPAVRWIDFSAPAGVSVTIPHQRNVGVETATGDPIVFLDAGCVPRTDWLRLLVRRLREHGEHVVAGLALAPAGSHSHYGIEVRRVLGSELLDEAPTINLAISRFALTRVGRFDERFEYGSDVDLTWRLVDGGFRIRAAPEAVVEHDWGSGRRQLRRAYVYGRARARLYRKHASRRRQMWRRDPVLIAYPLFLLGLPLTLRVPAYPLLLSATAWRNRGDGAASVVVDHLVYGTGALSIIPELLRDTGRARRRSSAAVVVDAH